MKRDLVAYIETQWIDPVPNVDVLVLGTQGNMSILTQLAIYGLNTRWTSLLFGVL